MDPRALRSARVTTITVALEGHIGRVTRCLHAVTNVFQVIFTWNTQRHKVRRPASQGSPVKSPLTSAGCCDSDPKILTSGFGPASQWMDTGFNVTI